MPLSNRPSRAAVATLAVVALGLSACAASGYTYVQSGDGHAFFKAPGSWRFYPKRDLVLSGGLFSSKQADQFEWLVGYDADPHPSLRHLSDLGSADAYPAIVAYHHALDQVTRDSMSLAEIRNIVYPVDRLLQANAIQVVSTKDITQADGIHGSQVVFDFALDGNFATDASNHVLRVSQTGLLDPATDNLYVFVVRCTADCYQANQTLITQIVNSWTVKEH
jgi:hypothetical protein